jgi:hypothetical protein
MHMTPHHQNKRGGGGGEERGKRRGEEIKLSLKTKVIWNLSCTKNVKVMNLLREERERKGGTNYLPSFESLIH